MQIITPRVHGILDYLVGAALIAAPFLLDIDGLPALVVQVFGAIAIAYSVITDYPLGVLKLLSYQHHLRVDVVWGVLLAASPWLLGFGHEPARFWICHVGAGVLGMLTPMLSIPLRRALTGPVQQLPSNR